MKVAVAPAPSKSGLLWERLRYAFHVYVPCVTMTYAGRFYDGRLYDMLELGVDAYKSIKDFGATAQTQIGNKVQVPSALQCRSH